MVTALIAERKVTALETAGARRKRVKNLELPTTGRMAVAGVGATSAGVRSTLRTGTVVCARILSTGRETVRSAELKRAQCWTKPTVPVAPGVRAVAAMVRVARSVRKKKWESYFSATFHMSHVRAGMYAYKKASPGTNVEIADGNILPVDGFGRIEVDLDQPGHTTKMVKMDDVAYVPGLSRNLLSTVKAAEQWGKPLIYYRNKAVLGFPGEESLVSKFCPRRGLVSATGARRIPRQEVALEASLAENGLVKIYSGTALAMRAGASRDVMEVHRMLTHPSEDITRKTAEMMGIETAGQWGACETCFQAMAK